MVKVREPVVGAWWVSVWGTGRGRMWVTMWVTWMVPATMWVT